MGLKYFCRELVSWLSDSWGSGEASTIHRARRQAMTCGGWRGGGALGGVSGVLSGRVCQQPDAERSSHADFSRELRPETLPVK